MQSFTEGIGRRFFAVRITQADSRTAVQSDQITEELELFDTLLEGHDQTLTTIGSHDGNRVSPWLRRTGWIAHLGDYALQPLALSVTFANLKTGASTPILSSLGRIAAGFEIMWAKAEELIRGGLTSSLLTLLKTNKRDIYAHQDISPFKLPEEDTTWGKYRHIWLTYVIFCARWYLETVEEDPRFSLEDSQRLIVAPHLLLMPIPLPGSEVDDVTLTPGLHRYLCPHLPFCKRNILI